MNTGIKSIGFLALLFCLASCHRTVRNKIVMEYPHTKKDIVIDTFFETKVEDPYRWLEDDLSEETARWIEAQNKITFEYLDQIPFRRDVRKLFDRLYNYTKYYLPKKGGAFYYYAAKDSGRNQPVIYRTTAEQTETELFLDPNSFSDDGTTSLEDYSFSETGKYMACNISESGSDWRQIRFINCLTGDFIEDQLQNAKFTSLTWYKDEGIFYSTYDKPAEGSVKSAMTDHHKLYYHRLGTNQGEDVLIFGNEQQKYRYVSADITEDFKHLIIYATQTTSGSEVYLMDMTGKENDLINLVTFNEYENSVIYISDTKVYLWTTYNAPNGRLVMIDLTQPKLENCVDLIAQREEAIENISFIGETFLVQYLKNVASTVAQYDLEGRLVRDIELPGKGSVFGFTGYMSDTISFFQYQSFTEYPSIYKIDVTSGLTEIFLAPNGSFDRSKYITEQVTYSSRDGTEIPMYLVYRKGMKRNGKTPALLYGYGGFNISEVPEYDIRFISWLEMGGLLAKPSLRGGGEFGEKWHKAGTKQNKQNVFDDFIAAAEYLHENKYTNPEKLTIMGRSNGGLLVGATLTQRPDLMKAAIPVVGVMDMLRYHKFTAGAGWVSDYGSADESEDMFKYLYNYSPVHNVRNNMHYPATIIATGDHDDRVVPAHSFKFAAQLQEKQSGNLPVVIRIDVSTGHGATGKPSSKYLDEKADLYTFAFFNMKEIPDIR